ncbi:hypothetical protein ScPMuIL_016382 [Solemya velum]
MIRSIKYTKSTGNIRFATRIRHFWSNSIRRDQNTRTKPLASLGVSDSDIQLSNWDGTGYANKAIILEKEVYENRLANGGHGGTEGVYNLHAKARDIGGQLKESTERLRALLEPTTEVVPGKPLEPSVSTHIQELTEGRTDSYFVQFPCNDIYDTRKIYIDELTSSRREARCNRLADQRRKWFLENTDTVQDDVEYSILDMLLGEAC